VRRHLKVAAAGTIDEGHVPAALGRVAPAALLAALVVLLFAVPSARAETAYVSQGAVLRPLDFPSRCPLVRLLAW